MKSYEIVGWTFEGAIYCTVHKPHAADDDEELQPVFADQAFEDDVCDVCFERLLE